MGVGAGLYMYVVVVQKFTFAISSPDEFLFHFCDYARIFLVISKITSHTRSSKATTQKPAIEQAQALGDISHSQLYAFAVYKTISNVCAVIATKPVHRLQICPTVHN